MDIDRTYLEPRPQARVGVAFRFFCSPLVRGRKDVATEMKGGGERERDGEGAAAVPYIIFFLFFFIALPFFLLYGGMIHPYRI